MQKIVVKHFRQISEATVEVRDVMFFIGQQASGKSTLVKLIYYFKSLKQEYIDIILHTDKSSYDEFQKYLIKAMQDKFTLYFGSISMLDPNFEVIYYFSVEENAYIALHKEGRLQLTISGSLFELRLKCQQSPFVTVRRLNTQTYASFLMQNQAEKDLQDIVSQAADSVFYDARNALFIPAGRNITVSYPEQFQYLFFESTKVKATEKNTVDMRLLREFISYSKFLVGYFADESHSLPQDDAFHQSIWNRIDAILHGRYVNQGGNERITCSNERYVPLNLASSGQQEVIRLIQDFIYLIQEREAACRIIEEPETHLFPSAQAALMQIMVMVAYYTGSQFILTTHSPHIMTSLNNLLYYTKVLHLHPDDKTALEQRFGVAGVEQFRLSREEFQAYALNPEADVYCKSVVDEETGLIGNNYIDEATESLYDDFDYLYTTV